MSAVGTTLAIRLNFDVRVLIPFSGELLGYYSIYYFFIIHLFVL